MAKRKQKGPETLPAVPEQAEVAKIDQIIADLPTMGVGSQAVRSFAASIQVADALEAIRDALTPAIMEKIMKLKNTPLGFMTDERKATGNKPAVFYDVNKVKEFAVETIANGFTLTGNEVNLIAGRMYAAKNGLSRKLREQKGFTELILELGLPKGQKDGSVVIFRAKWKMNGKEQGLSGEIPVRVNAYMGIDAILGKAERKAKYRILNQVVGSDLGYVDGDVSDPVDAVIKDAPKDKFAAGRSEIDAKAKNKLDDSAIEPAENNQAQPESAVSDSNIPMASNDQLKEIVELLGAMNIKKPEMQLKIVNDCLKENDLNVINASSELSKEAANRVIDYLKPANSPSSAKSGNGLF